MNKLILFSFAVFTFLSSDIALSQDKIIKNATAQEAKQLLSDGAILVDVRESDEVTDLAYNVEGMMNVPLSRLEDMMSELPKDKKLVIACRSGSRSMRAIKILQDNGYENLANLSGGIQSWQANGYEVVIDGIVPTTKTCGSKQKKEGKGCCSNKGKSKSSCGTKNKTE
jgi:rhodanese-related sulfurtransferase